MYVWVCACGVCAWMSACICMRGYVCVWVHVCVHVCVWVRACMYECTCACVCGLKRTVGPAVGRHGWFQQSIASGCGSVTQPNSAHWGLQSTLITDLAYQVNCLWFTLTFPFLSAAFPSCLSRLLSGTYCLCPSPVPALAPSTFLLFTT